MGITEISPASVFTHHWDLQFSMWEPRTIYCTGLFMSLVGTLLLPWPESLPSSLEATSSFLFGESPLSTYRSCGLGGADTHQIQSCAWDLVWAVHPWAPVIGWGTGVRLKWVQWEIALGLLLELSGKSYSPSSEFLSWQNVSLELPVAFFETTCGKSV